MTDTLFADISEFQTVVNDTYPHRFLSIRANDGTYRDKHFAQNMRWALSRLPRKLVGLIVYMVWELDYRATVDVLFSQLGSRHVPHMAVMIDIERWGGKITGDHSTAVRATREMVIARLFAMRPAWQRSPLFRAFYKAQDRKRVIIYGNAGDLSTISPHIGDARIVLANYSGNPSFPGKIAHQFSDHYHCPPFGYCDMNSADGRSPWQFARQLGMGTLRRVL